MTHSQRNAGLIFFVVAVIRLLFHWVTGYVADDAFITFRYAENIAAGLGFVYNEGERVLGTSTPLFTLILSLFSVLRLEAAFGALLISIVSSGLTAAMLYRYAERFRFGSVWAIPVVLYGLWPRAMVAETSGMETAFYTMLVVAAFYYTHVRRPYYALAAATLATVTRPEGALALVLVLVMVLVRHWRSWFSLLVTPAVILVPWLLFADWYFGSPVPHTIPAKLALYGRVGAGTPFERLDYMLGFSAWYGWVMIFLAVVGAIWLWRRQRAGVIEFLWLGGMVAFYGLSKTHMFFWYVTPLLPIYLLLVSASVAALFDAIDWLHAHQNNLVPLASLVLVLFLGAVNFANLPVYRQEQNRLSDTHQAIGYYLRTHTDEPVVVAAEDIGYIGATSKRRILDRDGLVSPEAVRYNQMGEYGQLIYDLEPDVVVASTRSPISGFINDSVFVAQYEQVEEFPFDEATSYLVFQRRTTEQAATR